MSCSSDDNSDKECPLCMEPLEIDDVNFYPCKCEYQICRFCWHRLRTDENGLCPACRQPYPEDPVNFKPLSTADLQKIKSDKQMKKQAERQRVSESRKHLASYRVLQKNLVYVVGLSLRVADPDVLRKPEYFGRFGKIVKVVVGSTTNLPMQNQASHTAYVTYSKVEEALKAIQGVNNATLDGRVVKASLGTTKYCSSFLRSQQCFKPECMYLHDIADSDISFTKDDMHAGKHADYERGLLESYMRACAKTAAQAAAIEAARVKQQQAWLAKNKNIENPPLPNAQPNGTTQAKEATSVQNGKRSTSSKPGNDKENEPVHTSNTTTRESTSSSSVTSSAPVSKQTSNTPPSPPRSPTPPAVEPEEVEVPEPEPVVEREPTPPPSTHPSVSAVDESAYSLQTPAFLLDDDEDDALMMLHHHLQQQMEKDMELFDQQQAVENDVGGSRLHKWRKSSAEDSSAPQQSLAEGLSSGFASLAALAPQKRESQPASTTSWQQLLGLSTTSPPPGFGEDDDLGFDPFSESAKGLQQLLDEERTTVHHQPRRPLYNHHQQPASQQNQQSSLTSLFGQPSRHESMHQQQSQHHSSLLGGLSSQPHSAYTSAPFGHHTSSHRHSSHQQPQLHSLREMRDQWGMPIQQSHQQHQSSRMHANTLDMFGGLSSSYDHLSSQQSHHSMHNGHHQSSAFGAPPGLAPPSHRQPQPQSLSEWQEGLKALLPNVNVRFASDLEQQHQPGHHQQAQQHSRWSGMQSASQAQQQQMGGLGGLSSLSGLRMGGGSSSSMPPGYPFGMGRDSPQHLHHSIPPPPGFSVPHR